MWTLRSSGPSPFGRKIKIGASLCGLSERISVETADTNDPADSVRQQNPLGKIPVLLLEDGATLYDSRVILEWLDVQAGGGAIIPTEPRERFEALTMQALADGLTDASILQVYERRFRPEAIRHQPWIDYQEEKKTRGLAALERSTPEITHRVHVGDIALACALGYLDLRFEGTWRKDHPRLTEWLERFAEAVSAFAATTPH